MAGLLLALTALGAQPQPVPERLPPVEQCDTDQSLAYFRQDLRNIVARKDERALLAILADDAEVSFGGDRGPASFAANWQFGEPGESRVWAELQKALAQGCAPSGDAFVAPSFVTQFPEQLDAFQTVIIAPGTPLRSGSSEGAHADGMLDWHLATVTGDTGGDRMQVKLVDGRQGFVRRNQTVNPLDFRLVFEKRGGKWLVTAFVAGD